MVAPYNYTIQAPSAFEQLVSGLKLGASMQEMQAAAEQRRMQMEQLRAQQEQQARQRQLMDDVIGGRANRGTWLEIGMMGSSEAQRKGAWDQIANMDQQVVRNQIGLGTQLAFSLKKNPAIGKQILSDALRANPNDDFLKRINQLAETDTDFAAQNALLSLPGLGPEGMAAYKETVNRLFPEKAPTELPEKAQLAQWYQTATPEQRQAYNQLFPPEVRSLTEAQQLEWYKNLPETDRALFDQMRGAGKTPLVQNVLPGQPTPPTEFEKQLDQKGSNVYVSWALEGGAANARARIAALQDVVNKLEASATGKGPALSGVQIQVIPEALRPLLVPAAQEARQNAERVIQDGLRAILGAQFTQVEGENFLKRAFDPALGPDRNARRLRLILEQMKESAKQAQSISDYVEANRSLRGFKGSYPSLAQFEAVLAKDSPPEREGQPAAQTAPTAPAAAVRRREIAPGVFVTERQ